MNEIEKMYKNVGIKKRYCGWLDMGDLDCQMQYIECDTKEDWQDVVLSSRTNKDNQKIPDYRYPKFTELKQFRILKILAMQTFRNYLKINYNYISNRWRIECDLEETCLQNFLGEAIAELINKLWNTFKDTTKNEIKEVLYEELCY